MKRQAGDWFILVSEVVIVIFIGLLVMLLGTKNGWELLEALISGMPFYMIPLAIVIPRRLTKKHPVFFKTKWHWIGVCSALIFIQGYMYCVWKFDWTLPLQRGYGALLAGSGLSASQRAAFMYKVEVCLIELSGLVGLMQYMVCRNKCS